MRCRKESEITIIVSQADGEPIHSKYRVHKKPLFTSGSFRFRHKKPKFVPDLTHRFPPQNINEESTNDFNKRKRTVTFHCPCYIWKWDFRSVVNKSIQLTFLTGIYFCHPTWKEYNRTGSSLCLFMWKQQHYRRGFRVISSLGIASTSKIS